MTSNYNKDPNTGKRWAFTDRGATFCSNLNSLLKVIPIESLRFISEMAERMESAEADFENSQIEADDLDIESEEYPFNPHQKVTIYPEQLDPIIADIDRLILWCNEHLAETTEVLNGDEPGWSETAVKKGITTTSESTTYPDEGYFGDHSGTPYFLFPALKSMQGIFKYARDNNISVSYENLAE